MDATADTDPWLSPFQAKLLDAASPQSSSFVPLLVGKELFDWAVAAEGENAVILSLQDPHLMRRVETAVSFGQSLFLTGFSGRLDARLRPALYRETTTVGTIEAVRILDNVVEFDPCFRRYLVADSAESLLSTMYICQNIKVFELLPEVVQIDVEMDRRGMLSLSCSNMAGDAICCVETDSLKMTIAWLKVQVARSSDLEPLAMQLVFPYGRVSSDYAPETMLAKVL